jgi:hypothetical protein
MSGRMQSSDVTHPHRDNRVQRRQAPRLTHAARAADSKCKCRASGAYHECRPLGCGGGVCRPLALRRRPNSTHGALHYKHRLDC